MVTVVLITGHLGSGKTELAKRLKAEHAFELIRTSEEVARRWRALPTSKPNRLTLQQFGAELDGKTDGKWLFDRVDKAASSHKRIVVDHIRNEKQLKYFRRKPDWKTLHVHLYGPPKFLQEVYGPKLQEEQLSYDQADPIESEEDIERFKNDADVRINVDRSSGGDTYIRVAARLGLFSETDTRLVDVLIGGQFGSEGKGHIAAYLARNYDLVVRVGGPNAGHTVSSETGRFTYHQLPSGARDFKAKVLLGPGMTIDKDKLLVEINKCGITRDRLCIDPQAMVIDETDKEAESRMRDEIASTASGSGAASARRIMSRRPSEKILARDDPDLEPYTRRRTVFAGNAADELERHYKLGKRVLLEGTQGSGLSIFHGEFPHVTSRDTNVAGCIAEAGISARRVRRVIMVVRTTPIRVGDPDGGKHTSGNIKNETSFAQIAEEADLDPNELKKNEKTSTTKRNRRVGWFDWELFRRSCILNTPTDIALTFADYLSVENRSARRFEQLTEDTIKFIEEIEQVAQAPVSLINTRFPDLEDDKDLRSIIDRRDWHRIGLVNFYEK